VQSHLLLVATVLALYAFGLRGRWRAVFVIGATLSLYFNVFVLVAQAFLVLAMRNFRAAAAGVAAGV
jgi:hypothetical protein